MPDLRDSIATSLAAFASQPLRSAAAGLLDTLGYRSERTLDLGDSSPQAFVDFLDQNAGDAPFSREKALFSDWRSADLLFQLTDQELAGEALLFPETEFRSSHLRSYLFFAIELNGDSAVNGRYARGKLTAIARQINRVFPMPVMVFIKHPRDKDSVLSIAVINRRAHKRDSHKDVLGKVTIIRDIALDAPHRGHLDILDSFALAKLVHPEKKPITDFDTLHAAWEEIFNVELLNERFYRELANWYFWALPQVDFPADLEPDDEKRRATGLIRLLTRLIFCWFIKEKGLVPEKLFHPTDLAGILQDFDPESEDSSQYYHAILQNLFFATLNQRMGKPRERQAKPYRQFAFDEGFQKNRTSHDVNNLYRYESLFAGTPEEALAHFADIPFLNGGLFECLDKRDEEAKKTFYIDGFSRNPKKRPHVPNHLFFADEIEGVDLSETYGDEQRKRESVSGLLRILGRYKFTIVENTAIDQEIALDPELLGKVFENLLASYNEETRTTARKQTGSFYTPRPIVDYMVDESLEAHLAQALADRTALSRRDAEEGLDILFAYTEREHAFSDREIEVLIEAIDGCKILDPACGSGAFPMGALHKLVFILGKLDPQNERWKRTQLAKLESAPMREALEAEFADNEDDYGRKLYLIENCLYGVDIQPIAIQITKLRFFISLVCDQKTNRDKSKNHGIRPLPNLETKFVAADTLIGLPEVDETLLVDPRVARIEKEIESLYHRHFSVQRRDQKLTVQKSIKELRQQLGDILAESLMDSAKARHVAEWDPFDPQASSDFFDPFWMFGIFAGKKTTRDSASLAGEFSAIADDELTATKVESDGFDIVIGNPPYVSVERFADTPIQAQWKERFSTYAARGDIYCFFYERGAQLLRDGGSLIYITSNKWMRAGYGKNLRQFLSSRVDTESVLDFGMAQNFGAATTYTCITRFYNQPPDDRIRSCHVTDDRAAMDDPAGYFAKNCVEHPNLSGDAWVVLPKDRQRIKTLVEEQGVPLEEWDIQINYGIKTGLNEAFHLTAEQRDALIAEDPASEELIGKLLRGRDVERYKVNWQQIYQLVIEFGAHESLEDRYPAVYRHLCQFETKLKARGQCKYGRSRKAQDANKPYPGQHHWLELDNNPDDGYLSLFAERKIMYPNMTKYLSFFLDRGDGYLTNDKGYIINSKTEPLEYLVAFLNSHVFRCSFRDNFPELMGNTYEVRKIFVEQLPVKRPTAKSENVFATLVPLIQFAKANQQPAAYEFLESLIDACVMECYFREHMAERDLLFLDPLAPGLEAYDPDAGESQQRAFLEDFLDTHGAPSSPIRQRLDRICTDSPDLLAVIENEGKVRATPHPVHSRTSQPSR